MTRLLPDGAAVPPGVLRRAEAASGWAPHAVLVEDGSGGWRRHAMAMSPRERARSVVLAVGPRALVVAAELGVGGAAWQPPSARLLEGAYRAAARAPASASHWDPGAAALLVREGAVRLRLPAWTLWREEAGTPVVLAALERAAAGGGGTPVPPASVLVPPEGVAAARQAWAEATAGGPLHGVALAGAGAGVAAPVRTVRELPGGAPLGAWTTGSRAGAWTAERGRGGWRWRCGEREVRWDRLETPRPGEVVRLPGGWAGAGPGSPGWLLLLRRVHDLAAAGAVPWAGGVDGRALSALLALGVRCWVDGPAVPPGRSG